MSNNAVFKHSDAVLDFKTEFYPAPASGAESQRVSKFPGEFDESDSREADLYITPLGIDANSLYNATLLFLPYFYSSRTYLVLKSARLAKEEIVFATAASKDVIMPTYWPEVKIAWNEFLDSLGNEWKTLNVISALLLSAVYNVLQLGGQSNSLTQCTALMSLFSALMSLIFGCLYLIRFETMRRTYKAIQWSSDALETSHTVAWNIYALLAIPSAWLAWSLIFFVVCLMSIVWQPTDVTIGSTSGLGPLHLASKIAVSALLFAGMVHFSFALVAFAGYGSRLDKSWSMKLKELREATATSTTIVNSGSSSVNPLNRAPLSQMQVHGQTKIGPPPAHDQEAVRGNRIDANSPNLVSFNQGLFGNNM